MKKVTAPTTQPYPVARNTYGSVMDAFSPRPVPKEALMMKLIVL